jgi:hypothetical protein
LTSDKVEIPAENRGNPPVKPVLMRPSEIVLSTRSYIMKNPVHYQEEPNLSLCGEELEGKAFSRSMKTVTCKECKLQDRVIKAYDQQEKLIEKKFGRKAAELANYGSSSGDDGPGTEWISTKVYGHGRLTTIVTLKSIVHEWDC